MNNQGAENIKCPKKTLVINFRGLKIGGIEVYLSKLIQYSTSNNYRVIWLTSKKCYSENHFPKIVDHPLVEKVFIRGGGQRWMPHKRIKFHPDEDVTMFSVDPINFMKGEQIRQYAKKVKSFNHFLVMPHFTGLPYYPERTFKCKIIHNYWYKFMKKFAKKLVDNDCIRAYSLKHLDAYEESYGVKIENKPEKVLKKINEIPEYDEKYFEDKARSRDESFEIVTCTRFDFPHKGFLLGLLSDYEKLKKEYPHIKLTIIGYGNDEAVLQEKIRELSKEAQEDITLVGKVSPQDLHSYFEKGHLNIGLAGALFDGAICALPSLCVRHFTENCETYGFISDMEGTYLRDEPAMGIKPFIEKMITIDLDNYINQAKRDFERAKSVKTNQPNYIFEQKNKERKSTIQGFGRLKAQIFNLSLIMSRIVKRIFKRRSDVK